MSDLNNLFYVLHGIKNHVKSINMSLQSVSISEDVKSEILKSLENIHTDVTLSVAFAKANFFDFSKINNDVQEVKETVNELHKICHNLKTQCEKRSKFSNKSLKILIVRSIDGRSDLDKIIKEYISPTSLKVKIELFKKLQNKSVLIGTDTEEELRILEAEIQKKIANIEVVKLKKKWPMICIRHLIECSVHDVRASINEQTGSDPIEIRLVKTYTNEIKAFVRVNPVQFHYLIKMEKINIGWGKFRIEEHVGVIRCFKCWQFGHMIDRCNASEEFLKFTENQNKLNKCSNCARFDLQKKLQQKDHGWIMLNKAAVLTRINAAIAHPTYSFSCPLYQKIRNRMKNLINYGKEKLDKFTSE